MKSYLITLTNSKGETRETRMDWLRIANEYRIDSVSKEGNPYQIFVHASEMKWDRKDPKHPVGTFYSELATDTEEVLRFKNVVAIKSELELFDTPFDD